MELVPFMTSVKLAKMADVSIDYLNGLIDENAKSLEHFGSLKAKGTGSSRVFNLNEPQATLTVLLMKNTPKSMDLKKKFINSLHDLEQEAKKWN